MNANIDALKIVDALLPVLRTRFDRELGDAKTPQEISAVIARYCGKTGAFTVLGKALWDADVSPLDSPVVRELMHLVDELAKAY